MGGDLVLKWLPVCVGGVWLDKRRGGGEGGRRKREEGALNGLKVQTNSRLERRCHVSALTSKRRLSEPRPRLAAQPLCSIRLPILCFFFHPAGNFVSGLNSLSAAACLQQSDCHPRKGVQLCFVSELPL